MKSAKITVTLWCSTAIVSSPCRNRSAMDSGISDLSSSSVSLRCWLIRSSLTVRLRPISLKALVRSPISSRVVTGIATP